MAWDRSLCQTKASRWPVLAWSIFRTSRWQAPRTPTQSPAFSAGPVGLMSWRRVTTLSWLCMRARWMTRPSSSLKWQYGASRSVTTTASPKAWHSLISIHQHHRRNRLYDGNGCRRASRRRSLVRRAQIRAFRRHARCRAEAPRHQCMDAERRHAQLSDAHLRREVGANTRDRAWCDYGSASVKPSRAH